MLLGAAAICSSVSPAISVNTCIITVAIMMVIMITIKVILIMNNNNEIIIINNVYAFWLMTSWVHAESVASFQSSLV